jgi:hypothetical protein
MKKSSWFRALCFACIGSLAASAFCGTREHPDPANFNVVACQKDFEKAYGERFRAVRVIDDRGTGRRWLLAQQFDRPEGPALLLQMPLSHSCSQFPVADSAWQFTPAHQKPAPIIRSGDSVIVREESAISDARLEAIALQPAATGEVLIVRLKLGGHLLRAIAAAPGNALLADKQGVGR